MTVVCGHPRHPGWTLISTAHALRIYTNNLENTPMSVRTSKTKLDMSALLAGLARCVYTSIQDV